MKNYQLMIVFLLLPMAILSAQTEVGGEYNEDLVWDIEGSPYTLIETVLLGDGVTLTIEPGVEVLFNQYCYLLVNSINSSLIAIGTVEDSIFFRSTEIEYPYWKIAVGVIHLEYCRIGTSLQFFDNDQQFLGIDYYLRSCQFDRTSRGRFKILGSIEANDCIFMGTGLFGLGIYIADNNVESISFRNSIFINEPINNTSQVFTNIDKCTFMFFNRVSILGNKNIVNSMFIFNQSSLFSDSNANIVNNIIYDSGENYFHNNPIEGFGEIVGVNENGDEIDSFGNLFMDPLIALEGDYPDLFYPLRESPCIDAGDPESERDPDGTIADIGPFYYPQPVITVPVQEIAFETDAFEGYEFAVDSAEFVIYNTGTEELFIDYLEITGDARANIFFDEDDTADGTVIFSRTIQPGDSSSLHLKFMPRDNIPREGYLEIVSNSMIRRDDVMDTVRVNLSGVALNVQDDNLSVPKEFVLHPLHPNPFNSSTQISFDLPTASEVKLSVFDINGRLLTNLVNGTVSAGSHAITWDASGFATGIYFVKLETANGVKFVQKAVMLR